MARSMDRVVSISDGANAAIHALALASLQNGTIAASDAAKKLGLSPTYLAKLLQKLSGNGFITSTRGIGGGFSLNRSAKKISCLEVLEAIDGPFPSRECLFKKSVCVKKKCAISAVCNEVSKKLRSALIKNSIADLAKSFID